ncbi:hypothetical protein LCGC14_1198460 [marine sediment metagenome]|uniref:Uncharacterized protein n=1 Tax=marine sediment metagenome TaxID=412755 RepID=A0A0F9P030_9ZZZZ
MDLPKKEYGTKCHLPQVCCQSMNASGDCIIKVRNKKIKEDVDYFRINMTVA